jgi:hypothetical protein
MEGTCFLSHPIDSLVCLVIHRLTCARDDECSVIEMFVNDRVALTGVVFPTLTDSVHVSTAGEGFMTLDVWRLSSTAPVIGLAHD